MDWYYATGDKVSRGEVSAIKWRKKTSKHLEQGDVEKVISLLEKLAKKRGVEEAKATRDYFKRNAERMRYAARREANLPEGSLMGLPEFAGLVDAVDLDSLGPQTIFELQVECRKLALDRADRAMLVWLLAQTDLNNVAVQAFRDHGPWARCSAV